MENNHTAYQADHFHGNTLKCYKTDKSAPNVKKNTFRVFEKGKTYLKFTRTESAFKTLEKVLTFHWFGADEDFLSSKD